MVNLLLTYDTRVAAAPIPLIPRCAVETMRRFADDNGLAVWDMYKKRWGGDSDSV